MNGGTQAALLRLGRTVAHWRARLRPAYAWLESARFERAAPPDESRGHVRVAAVQFPLRLFGSAREYVQECHVWAQRAVASGAQLIVFPELVGFVPLLGLLPGIESQAAAHEESEDISDDGLLQAVTRLISPIATRVYRYTFQNLSRRFGVHIAAGSAVVLGSDGTMRNTAFLFGPDGGELGHQAKAHLYGMEFNMGLTRGGFIQVYDTPVGKTACPVCMDHTYLESARIAYLLGAEILLDPAADSVVPYNWWYQMRGVWGRVQESPSYGVHAMMVGKAPGLTFSGRTAIVGPVDLVGSDGVMARADTFDQGELVVADLDLEALRAYRQAWTPPRYDWCARHLGPLWQQAQDRP